MLRPRREAAQWVQYDWPRTFGTGKVDLYWGVDRPSSNPESARTNVALPRSCRILYWDGTDFVPVTGAEGLRTALDGFSTTTFDEVRTSKLRVEVALEDRHSAAVLEWRVYSSGPVPELPPVVDAGIDRSVVMGGRTYLAGKATWLDPQMEGSVRWTMDSGPGTVLFGNAGAAVTTGNVFRSGRLRAEAQCRGAAGSARADAPRLC